MVLDTNVLLAGLATHGLCEALLKLIDRDHVVIVSAHILGEVARHYRGKFKATTAGVDAVVAFLRSGSELVIPAKVPRDTLRDGDDLPVLGTAVAETAAGHGAIPGSAPPAAGRGGPNTSRIASR